MEALPGLGLRPDARLPMKARPKAIREPHQPRRGKAGRETQAANGLPVLPFNNLVPRHRGLRGLQTDASATLPSTWILLPA